MSDTISPYLLDEPPTSTGRALLSRAFAHWCAVSYGHSAEEIASAFERTDVPDASVVKQVGVAARLIGELIAAGRLRTFARPFGGGSPEPIPPSAWELDDFRPRMARSAIDPRQPFNPAASPTHWLFADLDDFNDILSQNWPELAEHLPYTGAADRAPHAFAPPAQGAAVVREGDDRLVRLPELLKRTGMSRSTIYRRIEQGRFPKSLPIDGNIAAWREGDLAAWLANPR